MIHVFDLDGVLVDSYGPTLVAYREAFQETVKTIIPASYFDKFIWGHTWEEARRLILDDGEFSELDLDRIRAARLDKKLTYSAIPQMVDLYLSLPNRLIVTSGSKDATHDKMRHLGFFEEMAIHGVNKFSEIFWGTMKDRAEGDGIIVYEDSIAIRDYLSSIGIVCLLYTHR